MGGSVAAHALTYDFAVWARAMELEALGTQGIEASSMEGKRRSGRAMPPQFKEVPLRAVDRLSGHSDYFNRVAAKSGNAAANLWGRGFADSLWW